LLKTSTRDAVKKLMRDMIKRGLLLRLKEGVYWIIPYEQEAKTYFPNWHMIAQYLVGDTDAGGIVEIAKALYKSKDKIDYQKLYHYCERFKTQSVIKRLGFLLELLEINNSISESLQRIKSNSYILLEPSYERKGKAISKWNVFRNMETTDITSPLFT